jgi:hypothetical protein
VFDTNLGILIDSEAAEFRLSGVIGDGLEVIAVRRRGEQLHLRFVFLLILFDV